MSDSTTPQQRSEAGNIIKAHCPECGPGRLADVCGHYNYRDDDDDSHVWTLTDYRILQCRGCQTVYYQKDSIFSEDEEYSANAFTREVESWIPHKITYWPEPPSPAERKQPDWWAKIYSIDPVLDSLFDEIYLALANNMGVLAAIGIRTAFDRACELLGVRTNGTFAEKLTELVENGRIGPYEKSSLDALTDAGSAAAHRGWKPSPKELDTMMNIIEAFMNRTLILDDAAKHLKQNVPEKQKRVKGISLAGS